MSAEWRSAECIWIPDPRAEAYQTSCGDLIGTEDRSLEAEDRLTCPHCLRPVRFEDRPLPNCRVERDAEGRVTGAILVYDFDVTVRVNNRPFDRIIGAMPDFDEEGP